MIDITIAATAPITGSARTPNVAERMKLAIANGTPARNPSRKD